VGGCSTSRPGRFTPGERPGTHCIGGWVGTRAGLDGAVNLTHTGIPSPDSPARSQSLYRLSYPGPSDSKISSRVPRKFRKVPEDPKSAPKTVIKAMNVIPRMLVHGMKACYQDKVIFYHLYLNFALRRN
jgi:hypothetical protein